MLRRVGKKALEWKKARKVLIENYREAGIISCEGARLNPDCQGNWALSFHHLDKRSSGRAQHTFEETRLLCPECHDKAEYDRRFNELLRDLR